jgi:hypothetical protein
MDNMIADGPIMDVWRPVHMVWINGLMSFLDAAEAHRSSKGFMCYPCRICRNNKGFSRKSTLYAHLIERGFTNDYTLWTKHGEPRVLMEDDEDADDDNNIPHLAHLYEAGAFDDEPMDEAEENVVEEQPHDELGQLLLDAQKDSDMVKESKKFENMLEDHKKLLYPDCKQGHTKLGITLELLQWKAANSITDKGFEELLGIIKNMLLEGNELPSTT